MIHRNTETNDQSRVCEAISLAPGSIVRFRYPSMAELDGAFIAGTTLQIFMKELCRS